MATPTQRALITASTDTVSAGSPWAVTLPGTSDGAAVGHFALLILAQTGSTSSTDLSGWAALTGTPTTGTGSAARFYVWTKTLTSGDLSLTVHFTPVASSRFAVTCLVYDPATVDTSAITETQTSGTVMSSPSVDPTAVDGLLVTIFGPCPNTAGVSVTWTATAPIVEIVDICSPSTVGRNATMLVATEALTSGAVTGTRTGTPSGNVQRQTISLVLSPTVFVTIGAGATSLTSTSTVTKISSQSGPAAVKIAALGTPRRVGTETGAATTSLSAVAIAAKVTAVSGKSFLGVTSTGVALKLAPGSGTTPIGPVSTSTPTRISVQAGSCNAGATTLGIPTKVSFGSGLSVCGLTASGTPRRISNSAGTMPAALTATGTATKVVGRSGECTCLLGSTASPLKLAVETGPSIISAGATSMLSRVANLGGSGVLAASAQGTASKTASERGGTRTALTAVGTAAKVVARSGLGQLGLTTTGKSTKSTIGRGSLGLFLAIRSLPSKSVAPAGLAFVVLGGAHSGIPTRSARGSCNIAPGGGVTPHRIAMFFATNDGFYPGPDTFPGPTLFPGYPSQAVLFDFLTPLAVGVQGTVRAQAGVGAVELGVTGRPSHGVAGRCAVVVTGSGTAKRLISTSGIATLASSCSALASKSASPAVIGTLRCAGIASVRKTAMPTASVACVVAAVGSGNKRVLPLGINVIGLMSTGTGSRIASLSGSCYVLATPAVVNDPQTALVVGVCVVLLNVNVRAVSINAGRGSMDSIDRRDAVMANVERRNAVMVGV